MRSVLFPLTLALVVLAPAGAGPEPDPASLPTAAPGPPAAVASPALVALRPVEAVATVFPAADTRVARPIAAPRAAPPVATAPHSRAARPSRATPRVARPGAYAPGWQQRRGAAALRLIRYPWQDLGWDISFHPARRGLLGVASEPDRHIYVFVRRDQSVAQLAFTIAHEIGHAHDSVYGTRETHDRWRSLRGIDAATPWGGCEGCSDLETPAGDFAEVFAVWQVGAVDFRSRMAPLPTGDQLRALSEEFRTPREVYAQ